MVRCTLRAMLDVVLHAPEIPPNTGNAIRLCANAGARLHLVRPLGFSLEEKSLRRAGLDYRDLVRVRVHDSLDACLTALRDAHGARLRLRALSTRGTRTHCELGWRDGDAALFGAESSGLPAEVLARTDLDAVVRLPMRPGLRSINLSNAVAVVVYEAWRQNGFDGGA